MPGWNIIYAAVLPLIILMIWLAVSQSGVHKSHVTILGLFISIGLTIVLTDIVKNAVGRPRPDLIARCKPETNTPKHILVTVGVCTETNPHTLHDGWRSFPSGHSSFAFSGLGYLAVYSLPDSVPIYTADSYIFAVSLPARCMPSDQEQTCQEYCWPSPH